MKFSIPFACSSCGCDFSAFGYGEEQFPPAKCPKCGATIHIIDRLSISIVADRLLYRSGTELNAGDPTISIICSAIAIESALTSVFIKWKKIDHELNGGTTTDVELDLWTQEYRDRTKQGGFPKPANFVAKFLTNKTFKDFVADFIERNDEVALINAWLSSTGIRPRCFPHPDRIVLQA